jgi:hypothetical protein
MPTIVCSEAEIRRPAILHDSSRLAIGAEIRTIEAGGIFALTRVQMTIEILLGRLLAVCVHPQAAWRRMPVKGRFVLAAAYFSAAYVGVLATLLTL